MVPIDTETQMIQRLQKPTPAFIGASWAALIVGVGGFLTGLYNLEHSLTLKGYYFVLLMFGLFSAVSLQKVVRDKLEGIPVTNIYFGLAWISVAMTMTLMGIGLWNTEDVADSEKAFYGMAFALSLFSVVAVQKNVRDILLANQMAPEHHTELLFDDE